MITASELWLYPVKSLRGFRVTTALLTPLGFEWDRHWMLIDEKGKFLTQRKIPQMILINTQLTATHLVLSKAGMDDCQIPLSYPSQTTSRTASIWKDSCEVVFEKESVNTWLQGALNIKKAIFMVRMKQGSQRSQSKAHLLGDKTHTHFADAAPFLVANNASLALLNATLSDKALSPVSMEQFRPNIIIDGVDAFEEHRIAQLTHQDYRLTFCYPCQRCIMPTIHLESAIPHPQQEPFKSLMAINTMPDESKAPAFGENAILNAGEGKMINTGDTLSDTAHA